MCHVISFLLFEDIDTDLVGGQGRWKCSLYLDDFLISYLKTPLNIITKICLYNFDPHKPHFYIVKLGFTGVYIIFFISAQKHRLWVLVRTASPRRFLRVPQSMF